MAFLRNDRKDARVLSGDLYREAWEASADGLIFIDSTGIRAFDQNFERLIDGPVTDESVDRLFPAGCRPVDLLAAAEKSATRFCELRAATDKTIPARIEYIKLQNGLLTIVRLRDAERAGEAGPGIEAILDAIEPVIVVLDGDGRLVRVNRAARMLAAFSGEDIIGQLIGDVVPTDVMPDAVFGCLMEGDAPSQTESAWKTKDGSMRILSWSNRATRDSEGKVDYVIATATDVTEARQMASALTSISGEFMEAQSEERRSISRYLHDTVSQYLVVLALRVGKLQRARGSEAPDMTETLALIDRCCRDLRVISYALAPPVFDDIGPAAAFDWYTRHLREDAGIEVEFQSDSVPESIPPDVRRLLFAVVQEWAEKAISHPGKGKTFISLRNVDDGLELKFTCDRAGSEAVAGILGARVIRERIRILHGRFVTTQDDGLVATIWIPIRGVSQ